MVLRLLVAISVSCVLSYQVSGQYLKGNINDYAYNYPKDLYQYDINHYNNPYRNYLRQPYIYYGQQDEACQTESEETKPETTETDRGDPACRENGPLVDLRKIDNVVDLTESQIGKVLQATDADDFTGIKEIEDGIKNIFQDTTGVTACEDEMEPSSSEVNERFTTLDDRLNTLLQQMSDYDREKSEQDRVPWYENQSSEENEIPDRDPIKFSFEDFENEDVEFDTSTLIKIRDYILSSLANRRRNNNTQDKNHGVPTHEPPPRSRQRTNVVRDFVHNYFVRRDYPGQEYNKESQHVAKREEEPSRWSRFRNRARMFRPRHSVNIKLSPFDMNFSVRDRRHNLDNPNVLVMDKDNKIANFNDLGISKKYSVLEEGLGNGEILLCYPADVKLREDQSHAAEVVVMKDVTKNVMNRCADRFFDTNFGKNFARRCYNTLLL